MSYLFVDWLLFVNHVVSLNKQGPNKQLIRLLSQGTKITIRYLYLNKLQILVKMLLVKLRLVIEEINLWVFSPDSTFSNIWIYGNKFAVQWLNSNSSNLDCYKFTRLYEIQNLTLSERMPPYSRHHKYSKKIEFCSNCKSKFPTFARIKTQKLSFS